MSQKEDFRIAGTTGFTLVELLVVMSIISMLMSILMPSLTRTRESGRRVVCASNLRQLTLAWNLYAMDNRDRLCSPDTGCLTASCWVVDGPALPDNWIGGTETAIKDGVLWHYTQSVKLYECQSSWNYPTANRRPGRLRDYAIPATMGYPYKRWMDDVNIISTFSNLSGITRPSEKMVFTDADGGLRGARDDYWLCGLFWPLTESPTGLQWKFYRNGDGVPCNIITARHNSGSNLSFADGHCSYWRYKDQRTVKLADDETTRQNEIDASADNPDLEYMIELLKGKKGFNEGY
ncbi:MAG: type II secretion system protein [Phycisphaerae bacterium]|jgi:prepilin-type N-terminal cleavage/methylation domain-containing protein/prepilin-type processing-associated H-X9-DG protein